MISGPLSVCQAAATTAANGSSVSLGFIRTLIIEASGTFTGMTVVVEASIDDGLSWFGLSVATLSSTTLARVTAIVATGLYRLDDCGGLAQLRCRTTGTGGPVTVRAIAARG